MKRLSKSTVVLLVMCGIGVAYGINLIVNYGTSPNQIDFGEGFTMYIAKLFASHTFQWHPDVQPYMTMIYGPIYPILLVPFISQLGPDLRIGRGFCIAATVVIAVFIYLIARQHTQNKGLSLVAAMLPFVDPGYSEWIMQARCDMVAIMFAVVGFYIAGRWHNGGKLFWSIPFFALAFFTKQTAITAAISVVIYLFIKQRKLGLVYTATLGSAVLFGLVLANSLTDGQYLLQIFNYNITVPFAWPVQIAGRTAWAVFFPIIGSLAMLFVYVIYSLWHHRVSMPIAWFLVALFLNAFMMMRKGGFINYTMETMIAAGLCVVLVIHERPKQLSLIGAALVLQAAVCFLAMVQGGAVIPMPDPGYQQRIDVVDSIIKDTQQPILTENAGLVLNAGKVPYYEPFVYTNLEHLGYFDENIILNDLNNQKLDYIVLRSPAVYPPRDDWGHMTIKTMDAIQENYTIVYETDDKPGGGYFWYSFCVYEANRLVGKCKIETSP